VNVFENVGVFIQENIWFENSLSQKEERDKLGVGPSTETDCGG
jgi:hypothetical protein